METKPGRTVGEISRIEIDGKLSQYFSDIQNYVRPMVNSMLKDEVVRAQPESFLGIILRAGIGTYNTTFTEDSGYVQDGLGLRKLATEKTKYSPGAIEKLLDAITRCPNADPSILSRHIEEYKKSGQEVAA